MPKILHTPCTTGSWQCGWLGRWFSWFMPCPGWSTIIFRWICNRTMRFRITYCNKLSVQAKKIIFTRNKAKLFIQVDRGTMRKTVKQTRIYLNNNWFAEPYARTASSLPYPASQHFSPWRNLFVQLYQDWKNLIYDLSSICRTNVSGLI